MSMSPAAPGEQPFRGMWPSLVPYAVSSFAAAVAIVPVFHDMVAKSALQKGRTVLPMTVWEGLKKGARAAPTIGVTVSTQMFFQNFIEKALIKNGSKESLESTLISSAAVGMISAPILAVFNGQTMGWGIRESLQKLSARQVLAIAVQEAAFVGGLRVVEPLAAVMKQRFGDSKAVEYTAAFVAGSFGSLAGHPANTAVTRWQNGMTVDNFRQLTWGAARKARATGLFSVLYKLGKETLNRFETSK